MTLSVLFIHPAGAFGGASRSLLELIQGFPAGAVQPYLVTPRGTVAEVMRAAGIPVIETAGISQLDHTRYGHYRGKRWLLLLREFAFLPGTVTALLRARRRWPHIDVVHVNELTALPALLIARWLFRRPAVVHVRSVQRGADGTRRSRFIRRALRRHAAAVIAIDATVARSLPADVECTVIHNGFTPKLAPDDDQRPRYGDALGGPPRLRVGLVGNFLGFKGVAEFAQAAALCRDRGLACEFILTGGSTRRLTGLRGRLIAFAGLGHDVGSELRGFIAERGLEGYVRLAPFTRDVASIYRGLDLLCFPSHLDAVGRPVFEAAFWRIPGVVAVSRPEPDTFRPGETGLCVPAGDPVALADAIQHFCERPAELHRMGAHALALARENFDAAANAARVLALYERAVQAHR